jgi:hypothetical protein
MLQTIEGIIDQNGTLYLLEPMQWPKQRRVLITILKEEPNDELQDLALMSEVALARDWERPEEDAAWSHLAQLPSLQCPSLSPICRKSNCVQMSP